MEDIGESPDLIQLFSTLMVDKSKKNKKKININPTLNDATTIHRKYWRRNLSVSFCFYYVPTFFVVNSMVFGISTTEMKDFLICA